MSYDALTGMITNASLLLSLGVLYTLLPPTSAKRYASQKLPHGILIGVIGIAVMMSRWEMIPGLIFDTRSVLLVNAGLFFGPVATVIAMAITGGFRILQGGVGTFVGVGVILSSGLIGLAWRRWFSGREGWIDLLGLGVITHVVMLAWMFLLPDGRGLITVERIGLPVMLVYPAATMLLGRLLLTQRRGIDEHRAIRMQETRLQRMLQNAWGVITLTDADGTVRYVSGSVTRVLGYSQEEFTRITPESILHPDEMDVAMEHLDVLRGSSPEERVPFIRRVRHKHGHFVVVEGVASNLLDDPTVQALVFHIHDVTERNRTELELQETLANLKLAQRIAGIGMWSFDPVSGRSEWSSEVYQIYERDPELGPITVQDSKVMFSGDSLAAFEQAFGRAIEQGIPYDLELTIFLPSGVSKWVRVICEPEPESGPEGYRLRGTIQDISSLRMAERELRQIQWMLSPSVHPELDASPLEECTLSYDASKSEQSGLIFDALGRDRLSDITSDYLDLLGTASVIYEIDGQCAYGSFSSHWGLFMNCSAAENSCSCEPEPGQTLGPDRCPQTCWSLCCKPAVERGEPVDRLCTNGLSFYSVPIVAAGEIVGAVNFGYGDPPRDESTLREFAEQEEMDYDTVRRSSHSYHSRPPYIIEMAKRRLHMSARLIGSYVENYLAERERALLEDRYRQAQKMEAVGRLAGGVAHDFNNMLAVILGTLELAMDSVAKEDPLREDLDDIREAAQRSADLTRQLLAFSRRQVIRPRSLDLNTIIVEQEKMLRRLIGEHIEIHLSLHGSLAPIYLDPSQVDQILVNLLVNARDAISGTGTILVSTFPETLRADDVVGQSCEPGEYVALSVRDSGAGMDEETISHIFEPFFTTKNIAEGTGLGLATVYGIVNQNQGMIRVSSVLEQGSTFTLYFPRHVDEDTAVSASEVEALPEGDETIFVVEDEQSILTLTERILTMSGYRVITAATPELALSKLEELGEAPDMLITDVIMPGMDGHTLRERIRERFPTIRTLYISGYTADIIAQHGVIEDGVEFVQKPFSRSALTTKVRQILDADA